ncbi:hypothetical protein TI05_08870, partial [Achromatium sp. WMS3]
MYITRTKIFYIFILALAALLGNILSIHLFFGVHFIFGSIASLLAVVLLGIAPGIIVSLIGGLYTLALWGHPYALVIFAMEIFTVGFLYRYHIRNLVLADLAYWLVLGVPLIFLFYHGQMDMAWEPTTLIAFKQPLNGLLNALLAGFLLIGLKLYDHKSQLVGIKQPRLGDLLFYTMLTTILMADMIPIVSESYRLRIEEERFMGKRLLEQGQYILTHIDQNLKERKPNYWQAILQHHKRTYPEIDLALLDHAGQIVSQVGIVESLTAVGQIQTIDKSLIIWLPANKNNPMQRWKAGNYQVKLPIHNVPGLASLVIEQAAKPLVATLEKNRLNLFAFLASLFFTGIFIAQGLSRWLTKPLIALETASGNLATRIAQGLEPSLPQSMIQEYNRLSQVLTHMGERLAASFHELHQIQSGLEEQVRIRTLELERLSRVAKQTTNAVIITDSKRRVEWVNEGFTRITGYTQEEIYGHNPGKVLQGEETDKAAIMELRMALDKQQSFETTILNYTKSGKPFWVHINCDPLFDAAGTLQGFMAIETDITEQKKA